MSIQIAIAGAAGKMGKMLVTETLAEPQLKLVGASETPNHPQLDQDIGLLCGLTKQNIKLSPNFDGINNATIIDFTVPHLTERLIDYAQANQSKLVIGTTGLSKEIELKIEQAAKKIAIVYAPNMSIGINALLKVVADVAKTLGPHFDIEIVEAHHRHKKDAPSGTALRIAKELCLATDSWVSESERGIENRLIYGREGIDPRKEHHIAVHTVRGGDVAGDHHVHFLADGERIEITHRASSRQTFAKGAIRAALWLNDKNTGLYDMQDVLGLK